MESIFVNVKLGTNYKEITLILGLPIQRQLQ